MEPVVGACYRKVAESGDEPAPGEGEDEDSDNDEDSDEEDETDEDEGDAEAEEAETEVLYEDGGYCQACYDKLEDKDAYVQVHVVKPKTLQEQLDEMPDWGTAECVDSEKLKLVRAAAAADSDTPVMTANVWHVLVMTADSQTGELKLYLNGELMHESSGISADNLSLHPKATLFGGGLAAQNRGGDCRRLALYNRVLNQTEIDNLQVQCDQALIEDAAPKYIPPDESVNDGDLQCNDYDYYSDY